MEDFVLNIVYKNKTVKFKVANPDAPLNSLIQNLRHAIGQDGKLIFDFPSVDQTGAPVAYYFAQEDPDVHELRVLRPVIGKTDQLLSDYGVESGATLFIIPDPFPG